MGLLIIVSRDHPEAFRRLRYAFADDARMSVLFDRRYGSRPGAAPEVERRQRDIGPQLRTVGWAMVEEAAPPAPAAPEVPPVPPETARILLVEDDGVVREMLRAVLESAGYRPVTTGDPREALAHLATESFDLVITDLVMPHIDGLGVLEKARQRNPGAAILMMSAFGTEKLVREALGRGAVDFLAKPFEITPFLDAVRRILTRQSG